MANISLVTPTGRTSFMKIYKAEPNMNGSKNIFSLKLLFPKDMDMAWIQDAWAKACKEEFGNSNPPGLRPLFSEGNPFNDKGAIMDGDWKYANVDRDKQEGYEAYRGMWVMGFNADETKKPMVVDEGKNEIIDQSQFQSGDYGRVVCELSSYMSKKFKTPQVSIRFNVIQKMRDGEGFSGGMSNESALDLLGDSSSENLDMNNLL